MLSKEDKEAIAAQATFFHFSKWGHKDKGLWPAAVLASVRGAMFMYDSDGWLYPINDQSTQTLNHSLDDIMDFVGIKRVEDYGYTLEKEGVSFLKRFL